MTYTPFHADWKDYPDTTTPITAAALEYIEAGIVTAASGGGGSSWPVINVKDYGATGDGTTDDSAAIQAAIDDVGPTYGRTIYIPKGVYYLGTGLVATNAQIQFVGQGHPGVSSEFSLAVTDFKVGDGQIGLTLNDSSLQGFRVENVGFYEKNAGQALGGLYVKDSADGTFISVSAGRFTAGFGIKVQGTGGAIAQYNTFIDCRVGRCLYGYYEANGVIATRWIGGQADGGHNGTETPLANSIGFYINGGDSFRSNGTLAAGYDTLFYLNANTGHRVSDCRCEYWTTQAVIFKAGATKGHVSGSGDNSLIGFLGAGVVIEAGCEDIEDLMQIENVATAAKHIDLGTRTRFPTLNGAAGFSGQTIGQIVGKQAVYDKTDTLIGYTPIYDSITGISRLSSLAANSLDTLDHANITLTIPAGGVATGTFILIGGCFGLGSAPTITCTDTRSNSYQTDRQDNVFTGSSMNTFIISAKVTTALQAGDVVTVAFSTNVNRPILYAYTYGGMETSSWLDQAVGATGTSASPSSGNATTSEAGELLFSVTTYDTTGVSFTPGTGYALLADNSTTQRRIDIQTKLGATATTYTGDGTLEASVLWASSLCTYKAA